MKQRPGNRGRQRHFFCGGLSWTLASGGSASREGEVCMHRRGNRKDKDIVKIGRIPGGSD
jgi:hypothetical protein